MCVEQVKQLITSSFLKLCRSTIAKINNKYKNDTITVKKTTYI